METMKLIMTVCLMQNSCSKCPFVENNSFSCKLTKPPYQWNIGEIKDALIKAIKEGN